MKNYLSITKKSNREHKLEKEVMELCLKGNGQVKMSPLNRIVKRIKNKDKPWQTSCKKFKLFPI